MKRLVAIALTLILCLSLCSFAAAEETDVYGKYEEPIKLTILSEDFKTGAPTMMRTTPAAPPLPRTCGSTRTRII